MNEKDWRDTKIWHTHEPLLAKLLKVIIKIAVYPFVDVQFIHRENLPQDGACIAACNHVNTFDPFFLGLCMPRHPHFMAKTELFNNKLFGLALRTAGTFPVNRSKSDKWALVQAGRVLDNGRVLFMYPEGTRSGNEAILKRGKTGAVRLALEHQAPIVPMVLWGVQYLHVGLRNSNKLTIEFGKPLDVVSLAGPPPHTHKVICDLTDTMMRHIAAMLPPNHRGVYGEGQTVNREGEEE